MEKKPPKKSGLTPEYDSQREQNVLLEKIYSEVRTVAEGHGGLDRKIDKTNERLDEMDAKIEMISSTVAGHGKRFDSIDAKLEGHEKRFDRIESAIIENSKDIQLLKAGQKALEAGQIRIEQKLDTVTLDHEQRIQKLELVH